MPESQATAEANPYIPPAAEAVEEESLQPLPDHSPAPLRHGAKILAAAAIGMTLPAGLAYFSTRNGTPVDSFGKFSLTLTATLLLLGLGGFLLALAYSAIAFLARLFRVR